MGLRRVVITGLGIVSPLGVGISPSWKRLLDGGCGIIKTPADQVQYTQLPSKVAGFVPLNQFNPDNVLPSNEQRNVSTSTLYALGAADQALKDANWFPVEDEKRNRTGVSLGTAMSDVDFIINTGKEFDIRGYKRISPYFVPKILTNMAAGVISVKYGFRGPNHSVATACATGVHAIGDAFALIQRGAADVMVCGGAECKINPFVIGAFCAMRALTTNPNPTKASRPFDESRDGFVMGEGAGVIVLETLDHAERRGAPKIYGEVLGYGLSGDAYHITASSPSGVGAFRSMEEALKDARISAQDVGYINAHATSTPIGDAAEGQAIMRLFGPKVAVSSTKGATGHLLGAAGAVEFIFATLSCFEGFLPPNLNLVTALEAAKELNFIKVHGESWNSSTRRIALNNSFGFGGTNASLVVAQF